MEPVRPDYEGACISRLVAPLLGGRSETWFPSGVSGARRVVLLVLDGLGWNALEAHRDRLPVLSSLDGRAITTVVPSTTTVALTSLTLGLPPAEHGIVGYRMLVGGGVLNVLRWSMPKGIQAPDPEDFQPRLAFAGQEVPAVTRAEFRETAFTDAHLRGARFTGAHAVSSLVEHCRVLVEDGERFVYVYYGGIDIVAHMQGLRDGFYPAELAFADELTGRILEVLDGDTALVVTSDHGHVHFTEQVPLTPLAPMIAVYAGEGRFRSLHARAGAAADLLEAATEAFGDRAWVFSRERLCDEGWFGPIPPSPPVARRIGDVVLAAHEPLIFVDPTNRGEQKMLSGHGSLTPDEMLVPLLVGGGSGTPRG